MVILTLMRVSIRLFNLAVSLHSSFCSELIPDQILCWMWFVFWRVIVFTLRLRVRLEVLGWDRWRDAACVLCFCINYLFYWDCLLSVPLSFTGCDVKMSCWVFVCVFDWLYSCRPVSHKQRLTLACTLLSLWKRVWDEKKPCL